MPSHASAVSRGSTSRNSPASIPACNDRFDPALVLPPAHAELLGAFVGERRELVQEHPHVIGIAVDDAEQLVAEHRQLLRR